MSDLKRNSEKKKQMHCVECPIGLDDCVECGVCDHCDHDAALDERDLPQSWLRFIEKSKESSS